MRVLELQWLEDLKSQLRANARLRFGVCIIVLVLWLYAVLWTTDSTAQEYLHLTQLTEQVSEARELSKQTAWPERAKAASEQFDAIQALAWSEADQGLAEAQLRDWLSAVATKSGVVLRELAFVRTEEALAPTDARSASTRLPQGYVRIRLRLTGEFSPLSSSAMLSELAQGDRMVRVERLKIGTVSKPQLIEMDLAAVVRMVRKQTDSQ